jgi:rhodanese-related sulfurtransferase
MVQVHVTVKELSFQEADDYVAAGAAFVDLRSVDEYLDVHIPGSLSLQYEFGPGFPVRARDCIPLSVPLVLLDRRGVDLSFAAASLRGKGFAVVGAVDDGLNSWAKVHGTPASTEVIQGATVPTGTLLTVGDPGAPAIENARSIAVERLWTQVGDIEGSPVIIVANRGVRAALAVGMLERAGRTDVALWRPSRQRGPAKTAAAGRG